jgi:large subunit ribosomal protein L10
MENPRPEKVAVVDEVRERFSRSDAAVLTEYRGLNVADISALRRSLRAAGGDYKIYKNTLVRFAARDLGLEIEDLLTGPTAIAFVDGDPVAVAKALRDFARNNQNLVVKGGVLGDKLLSADETRALADVAPREELLARLAGAMAAPMVQFAGLLQALPRNFAYGLAALIDQQGGVPASTEPDGNGSDASPADPAPQPEASAPVAEATDETAATAASDDAAPAADEPEADPAPDTDTEPAVAEAAETPTEDN